MAKTTYGKLRREIKELRDALKEFDTTLDKYKDKRDDEMVDDAAVTELRATWATWRTNVTNQPPVGPPPEPDWSC